MKVRFIANSETKKESQLIKEADKEGIGVYEVLGYGGKVFIKVGKKIFDVFPSRLEIVDEE